MARGITRASAGVALLTALAACGAVAATASPEATVAAFADALRERRYEDAYALMSRDYRSRVPEEQFVRHLEDNVAESQEAAASLSRRAGRAEQTAVVELSDGDRVEMASEGQGWRIVTNLADFYDQSTPRGALRSFVRAMERRRYDVVMRLVPDADREGMTEEMMAQAWSGEGREGIERLIANLRAHLDSPIEEVADRATMPYGDRFTAQLVREDGRWKVEDPD